MRAYEGREAVLLELLETKALIKANADSTNRDAGELPVSLRNSPGLAGAAGGRRPGGEGNAGGDGHPEHERLVEEEEGDFRRFLRGEEEGQEGQLPGVGGGDYQDKLVAGQGQVEEDEQEGTAAERGGSIDLALPNLCVLL